MAALRAYSTTCSEPPFFFLDTMAINQHTFFLGSTSDKNAQDELLGGLRSSLRACGNLVLVCMSGPDGAPGWMAPAPFKRIWCLFEIYIALTSELPIAIQFGGVDEHDFRVALHSSGGRKRIAGALTTIDAERAQASIETDRDHILAVVEREMGLLTFNEFIRDGIRREYSNINKRHSFR